MPKILSAFRWAIRSSLSGGRGAERMNETAGSARSLG